MRRRIFFATPVLLTMPPALQATETVRTLPEAMLWLDRIERTGARSTGLWPLSAVLQHLAQSIEMSMDGFPQPKPPWFQATLGSAAFAVFQWRGRMSHGLAEPIPGAPGLDLAQPLPQAMQRLRAAITRFEAYQGALRPHFAYGTLGKSDYAQAHILHIANHQDEIVFG
ncbi:MAG: DUF1569 domain-containing protein [Rhodoferax sp.]